MRHRRRDEWRIISTVLGATIVLALFSIALIIGKVTA